MARRNPFDARSAAATVALMLLACAVGCEERVENPTPPAQAMQQRQSQTVTEGGGAGLGKARDAATGIEQKVDDYNRQLEKQIDDMNK